MNCQIVHKKLIFYLEQQLPGKEMQAFREHLEKCPDCALFAKDMRATLAILDEEKTVEVNPFFYTRVKAKLENQHAAQTRVMRRPVLVRILQPVAFSIILLLGVYGGIRLGNTGISSKGNILSEQEMIPFWNQLDDEPIEMFLLD